MTLQSDWSCICGQRQNGRDGGCGRSRRVVGIQGLKVAEGDVVAIKVMPGDILGNASVARLDIGAFVCVSGGILRRSEHSFHVIVKESPKREVATTYATSLNMATIPAKVFLSSARTRSICPRYVFSAGPLP